ncbi:MAG: SGNH/GDSL hydrolase family protein [Verrucomicrobiota bacterium]
MKNRRQFLISIGAATGSAAAVNAQDQPGIKWIDAESIPVEGRGWEDQERQRFFDRFPAKAEENVRDVVWNLSRHSAGMAVRFQSNATTIHVRYTLMSDRLDMPHMPATGVSGIDLYARDGDGNWRWVNVTRPNAKNVDTKLASDLDAGDREFLAYFPLYNGVDKVEFGVASDSKFEPLAAREKPMVFYGTSITHGACASRPGMCHPAILGRRLDRPVLNLGFSGNGRLEIEVAELMTELDASVFVIDCLPNLGDAKDVAERTGPLVNRLRKDHPKTPIVLVEDRTYDYAWIKASLRARHDATRAALRGAFEQMMADGVSNLHYIEGANLIGQDGDGTTDGSHPNDLGFLRQAEAMEPTLKKALGV